MPDDPGPSRATSRIAIDIRVAAADWRAAFDNPAAAIRKAVRAALKDEIPRGSVTGLSILLTDDAEMRKIGRAHVCTPVTNAHLVCRLLLEKQNTYHSPHTHITL